MTELATMIQSDERGLLNIKVEIRRDNSSTELEEDIAHWFSTKINYVLTNAAMLSSFRKNREPIKPVVLVQGELF